MKNRPIMMPRMIQQVKTESSDDSSPHEIRIRNRVYTVKSKYGAGVATKLQDAQLVSTSEERGRMVQSALQVIDNDFNEVAPRVFPNRRRKLDQVDLLVAKMSQWPKEEKLNVQVKSINPTYQGQRATEIALQGRENGEHKAKRVIRVKPCRQSV